VLTCGTCIDTRGLADDDLLDGAERSTMQVLSEHTQKDYKEAQHVDMLMVSRLTMSM
jgi:sulfur relay (sulfurtransferase) complex TusBCD TusD component (DsrE family)